MSKEIEKLDAAALEPTEEQERIAREHFSRVQKPELLPDDVCPCLLTKTRYLNTHHRRSAFESRFTADTAIFCCLNTMCNYGPDDDDVEPELCRPGRECYPDMDLT